jgi:hypothetical protein
MKKTILSLTFGLCIGMAGVAQVPFSQNFEGTNPPTGWTLTSTNATEPWAFGTTATLSSSYFAPPAHTTFAAVNDDNAGSSAAADDAFLKTPNITSIPAGAYLSFDYYFLGQPTGNAAGQPQFETFNVNISTDGGTTWTLLNAPAANTTAWVTTNISLAAYSGMNIMLAFEYNDGNSWMYGAAVDNIAITVPPATSIEYYTIAPTAGSPASYVVAGNSISITGKVINLGTNAITSYTASYNDGTGTHSSTIAGTIAIFDTGSFTITTPYTVALGSHPIKSWITLPADANLADDTLNTVLVGASFWPSHEPVIEEAGGCWCGWCPRGVVYMDSMNKMLPYHASLISVHDVQGGTDPMAVTVYDNGITALPGFTGFPAIAVDRKEILDPSQIFQGYTDHVNDFGFADLTFTPVVTGTTSISGVATVKPAVDLTGTYQLALVLTEDDVHNTATTYQQHDYYSGGSDGPLGDGTIGVNFAAVYTNSFVPSAAMKYNHVARSISGSFIGNAGSLPGSMTAGTTYTYNFASTSLTAWNVSNMRCVLMLIDSTQGIILNSISSDVNFMNTGIAKNNSNITEVNLFPNPANNSFNMNVNLTTAEKTDITLYNVMGQVVSTHNYNFSAGENIVNIPTDQLSTGMYMVLVSSPSGIYQTKVNVIK